MCQHLLLSLINWCLFFAKLLGLLWKCQLLSSVVIHFNAEDTECAQTVHGAAITHLILLCWKSVFLISGVDFIGVP